MPHKRLLSRHGGLAVEPLPPRGLQVHSFVVDSDEYLLIDFPLPSARTAELCAGLTPGEQAVAELVLRGQSNSEIAGARGTSLRTVANQIASIYRKVGVRSRRELFARQRKGSTE